MTCRRCGYGRVLAYGDPRCHACSWRPGDPARDSERPLILEADRRRARYADATLDALLRSNAFLRDAADPHSGRKRTRPSRQQLAMRLGA
jgi:hypothetical protein